MGNPLHLGEGERDVGGDIVGCRPAIGRPPPPSLSFSLSLSLSGVDEDEEEGGREEEDLLRPTGLLCGRAHGRAGRRAGAPPSLSAFLFFFSPLLPYLIRS